MKNVVIITYDFLPQPLWGVGTHAIELIKICKERKLNTFLITRNPFNLKMQSCDYGVTILRSKYNLDRKFLINQNSELESYKDFDMLMRWNSVYMESLIKYFIKHKIKPDIVHNHTWMTWPIARGIARFFNIPIVSSVHFLEKQYLGTGFNPTAMDKNKIYQIENELLSISNRVIVFSNQSVRLLQEKYLKFNLEKLSVIPHAIDINYIEKFSREHAVLRKLNKSKNLNILFVGRLVPEKGIKTFLRVSKRLLREDKNLQFTIVGTGDWLGMLKTIYEGDRIIFLGVLTMENLYKEYLRADIFCLPTLTETFGLAILEAMAFGLPVVTTRGYSVPNYIKNIKTGLLIDIKYKKGMKIIQSDLYHAIKALICNRALRLKISKNAKMFVLKNFDIRNMSNKTINVYYEVCNNRNAQ